MLFGHVFELGLGAVEESFAEEAARADGDFALIYVIAGVAQVFDYAEGHLDSHLLVVLQVVEGSIDREEEAYRQHCRGHAHIQLGAPELDGLDNDVDAGYADYGECDYHSRQGYSAQVEYVFYQAGAAEPQHKVAGHFEPAGVYGCHGHHHEHHHKHHGKLARGYAHDACFYKFDAHNEYHHGEKRRKQHQPAHSFAVQHEEECHEGEGGACFVLEQYQHYRHEDYGENLEVVRGFGV